MLPHTKVECLLVAACLVSTKLLEASVSDHALFLTPFLENTTSSLAVEAAESEKARNWTASQDLETSQETKNITECAIRCCSAKRNVTSDTVTPPRALCNVSGASPETLKANQTRDNLQLEELVARAFELLRQAGHWDAAAETSQEETCCFVATNTTTARGPETMNESAPWSKVPPDACSLVSLCTREERRKGDRSRGQPPPSASGTPECLQLPISDLSEVECDVWRGGDLGGEDSVGGETTASELPEEAEAAGGQGSRPRLPPDGTVSSETSKLVFLVVTAVNLPLTLLGATLNALTLAVLMQPSMRRGGSSHTLWCLSLVELTYLLLKPCSLVSGLLRGSSAQADYVYLMVVTYVTTFAVTALRRAAFLLTFLLSLERLVVLACPLRAGIGRCGRRTVVTSVVVVVVSLLVHVVFVLKYRVVALGDTYTFEKTWLYETYQTEVDTLAAVVRVLLVYVPLFGVLLLNPVTAAVLARSRRLAASLGRVQAPGRRDLGGTMTSVTILTSTLVYMLLSLPPHLLSMVSDVHSTLGFYKQEHFLYVVLVKVFSLTETLSNCTNFIVYTLMSASFRQTLIATACPRGLQCCVQKSATTCENSLGTRPASFSTS